MPKLAIYVPKEHMKAIEKWRKKINFSQVFMKALLKEIEDRSRTVSGGKNKLAAAAAFYKQKLSEGDGPLMDFGFELGSKHVMDCKLPPEAIRSLLGLQDRDLSDTEDAKVVTEAIAGDQSKVDQFFKKQKLDERANPTWRAALYRGYVKGVAATWERICGEM